MTKLLLLTKIFRYFRDIAFPTHPGFAPGYAEDNPFGYINTCKLNVFESALGRGGQLARSKPPCMLGNCPPYEGACRQTVYWERSQGLVQG